jgi:hypothetical protein
MELQSDPLIQSPLHLVIKRVDTEEVCLSVRPSVMFPKRTNVYFEDIWYWKRTLIFVGEFMFSTYQLARYTLLYMKLKSNFKFANNGWCKPNVLAYPA